MDAAANQDCPDPAVGVAEACGEGVGRNQVQQHEQEIVWDDPRFEPKAEKHRVHEAYTAGKRIGRKEWVGVPQLPVEIAFGEGKMVERRIPVRVRKRGLNQYWPEPIKRRGDDRDPRQVGDEIGLDGVERHRTYPPGDPCAIPPQHRRDPGQAQGSEYSRIQRASHGEQHQYEIAGDESHDDRKQQSFGSIFEDVLPASEANQCAAGQTLYSEKQRGEQVADECHRHDSTETDTEPRNPAPLGQCNAHRYAIEKHAQGQQELLEPDSFEIANQRKPQYALPLRRPCASESRSRLAACAASRLQNSL